MVADSGASRVQIHGRGVERGSDESLLKSASDSVEQTPRKLPVQVELLQGICSTRATVGEADSQAVTWRNHSYAQFAY